MYYVYILISKMNSEKIYIGVTNNLRRRLFEHNSGESKYSKHHRPWSIGTIVGFKDKSRAEDFEHYLKQGTGFAFMKKHLLPLKGNGS